MRILHHARIRTLNSHQPFAAALAVENGRILAVGSNKDVLALANRNTQIEDLHGQTVWPGLTDAHLHLEAYAASLDRVDCETATLAECLGRIAERARVTPDGAWILGHGFDQNQWQGGYGTAGDLDAAAGDRPVYITAKSLHAGWANSAALRMAGVDRDTPEIEGGQIQRDRNGVPTGILLENAVRFVERILPAPDEVAVAAAIERAQEKLWSMGLTGVHDNDRRRCFQALQQLDQQGRLRLRVVKNLPFDQLAEAVAVGLRSGFGGDFLRIGSIKMFADGALGPQTAAMLQPYQYSANTGVLQLDAGQVFEAGEQAVRSGLSLAIHAIGDCANHEVLAGYEMLRAYERQNHLAHLRHRIEHVQILAPGDLHRLTDLDLVASVQPIHATSDMDTADRHLGSRTQYAYAYRTLLEAGTRLAFGSDAPVESPNPFLGLHAAVNRTRPSGYPGAEGWRPEQRISLEAALAAYTTGPAFAAGRERELGQLMPDFYADLIVLAEDPFDLPPQSLHNRLPAATMVGGEWVFRH
ncbi:predicted metal-dependent hydrolase with the TIM-barrel fold [Longilinea arvoryzae]|uniref:Predicted metal-dependent hydrolase with the TIM-barrel fold n=1 Tax=Longilinea arvoryzae TaxID=360412 RepID=A0A0S7BBN6_9CHLR|nr:amidohydrolase [Longilinea arvoryzae]GAP15111.1 predicted metal-dependent hydrolase with the TIM-barrel fold [Longilinea arvoryzae]